MQRPFRQIDVFTTVAYRGNPVAVVLDSTDLDSEQMQRFAHWTNLSETTFVLPPNDPGADYRLRIFTPVAELPFAGHPTLGTCHAWLSAGGSPKRSGHRPHRGRRGGGELVEAVVAVERPTRRRRVAANTPAIAGAIRGSATPTAWRRAGPGWPAGRGS